MVKPAVRRRAVEFVTESHGLSVRRACGLVGIWRSTFSYESRRPDDQELKEHLKELAAKRPRWGYRRLHVLLRRAGVPVNHKRVYRLYREEGLTVRRKKRKRMAQRHREVLRAPGGVNQRWSIDFMRDTLANGRVFRVLNIVDDFSRECPAIEVDTSLSGRRVTRVLDDLALTRGLPEVLVMDNGPEFTSRALDQWAYRNDVRLEFIRPGKPIENAFVESFNGKFRDECLNENWFLDLNDARRKIERWRLDYNSERPHSSLGQRTPNEFARMFAREEA
jgi:putative transposase